MNKMMKGGIMIICALLCIQVAYGYPAELSSYHNSAAIQELDHPTPPEIMTEHETMLAAKEDAQPSPRLPNRLAFMQMLNDILINEESNQNAQASVTPTVPSGLKSTSWNVKIKFAIRNRRAEDILFWWVDYSGKAVCKGKIPSGHDVYHLTYGTHPWLITKTNGDLITYFVPCLSNMDIVVENNASWNLE